ncbi:uncharacterized protein M421DRAFT_72863 [Didymella exigua CBS 183.55]|uniref:Fungal N-terminal domain-containing protein n=1 Tax=Didymella exigua CBS 183.55 TaxID=1150837 RepID=A0A6A5R991_9PLEO|nr:uncharacterized protein M421DRAFT_72863 [Didymella exigua CBS 183.55]KAF1924312.1 hypothetical protein M421DRAFT_72863 [Didymella exigua CBS 183.55]
MSFGISIGDLIKLGEVAGRVYKNCRDCTGDYKHLTIETRSLTNLLDDIQDKYDKIPAHKREQLLDAYKPCIDVLSELDKLLEHYNLLDTKSKRAWDRLKWDPEKSRSLRERLVSSVVMLNAFYNSLIHDNQVLILEALGRLELDYKGGYREESIASIERIAAPDSHHEEVDDDAAWTQIIRDLEDVGISHQVVLTYRDFVVDWFIRAVNEGRLLEERRNTESLSSTRPFSSDGFQMNFLSASLATTDLNGQNEVVFLENDLAHTPGIAPLQRSNSSNAPEPLHIHYNTVGTPNESITSSLPCDAPEPVHLPSPSTQAPEPIYGINQDAAVKVFRPVTLASQAPEPVSSASTLDLNERAQGIADAWARHDFVVAARLLEEQLAAVEQGCVASNGLQPDRRVLRHCIGVCASFSGDLMKAKLFFESAFNGIYLIRNLDEGDIAAARWLGDVCLQLREFHNTVLAWSVALEGSIRHFGISHDRSRHIIQEMLKLDEWVSAFEGINSRIRANVDPTDIFSNTHTLEKSDLVRTIQARVNKGRQIRIGRPSAALRSRPRLETIPGEAFLTAPLVSSGAWPLQWDSMFSPMAVYQTQWYLKIARPVQPALALRTLRWNSLGESKKLDYATKAGNAWLVETVKAILRELEIEHADHPDENVIVCCLHKDRDGLACTEGVFIAFSRLQFRNVCGVRISDVRWSTRKLPSAYTTKSLIDFDPPVDTEFRDTIKEMLGLAEARPSSTAPIDNRSGKDSRTRSWNPWGSSK